MYKCIECGKEDTLCKKIVCDTCKLSRQKRKQRLVLALEKAGVTLREDSKLCTAYINGTESDLPFIVKRMCQMRYLYDFCKMLECKNIVYKEQYLPLKEMGLFPDGTVFSFAEEMALQKYSNGKYPDIFPWQN
jgi:hypothetical protein